MAVTDRTHSALFFLFFCFLLTGQETSALDLPEGNYTQEEIYAYEHLPFDSSWSSKTPPGPENGGHEADVLTIVLDFKPPGSPTTTDINGFQTSTFDVTLFGFAASQFDDVVNAIVAEVDQDYFTELIGTVAGPPGRDLKIDFVVGTIGTPPVGVSEYYFIQIGDTTDPRFLGVAGLSVVRNALGIGPNFGIQVGDVVGSVFPNVIQGIPFLTPANALTSGNLAFTTFAIAGTVSHEIGHTLSLLHMNKANSMTPTGLPPIMGTGAIDLPNQDRIGDREFSLSGFNAQSSNNLQVHIQQLTGAVGLHDIPNLPPVASFSVVCATTTLVCTFTDQSTDPDGTVTSWLWGFGDGNISTLQNPVHTYAAAGTVTVSLTVTDNDGATNTATQSVTLVACPEGEVQMHFGGLFVCHERCGASIWLTFGWRQGTCPP